MGGQRLLRPARHRGSLRAGPRAVLGVPAGRRAGPARNAGNGPGRARRRAAPGARAPGHRDHRGPVRAVRRAPGGGPADRGAAGRAGHGVRDQPDADGPARADPGPPPARLPGVRPDGPENPCLTRPVLLVANALVPFSCDPYSHRRERREDGGGRCAFYRPGGTPRCPIPTRPWESATPSARTSAGTGTATKTPPTRARGCLPWRTAWAGTRAARWPAPRRSRRSARWTPRYPPRT